MTVTSSTIFPLEIEEIILDLLAEDEDEDEGHSTLKTCSLVCQAFLPICRKHIFGSIVLSSSTTRAFERLLRETPEIADYIRKLDYHHGIANFVPGPSIQESLKRITRLKFLTVRRHFPSRLGCQWSNYPIRPALLQLLHLPTLTHFKALSIYKFVVSDLIPCVNLKYLEIDRFTSVADEYTFPATLPEHSIQLNEFFSRTRNPAVAAIMKFFTAQRPDGQPIIDFGSLSKITLTMETHDEGEASQELFKRCHSLTNVNLTFWDPRYVKPSLSEMLRPSMQTLKHISVNINVPDDNDDPLFDILSEFEDMRSKNIIETITIKILIVKQASCRQGDDWGRLDEVLTTPGWFSLKRVTVSLAKEFSSSDTRRDVELGVAALRKLPESQFPRLSSSNSVSFNFKVTSYKIG